MKIFGRDFKWWKEAAEKAKENDEYFESAALNVANMYYQGDGVEKNYGKAFEWYMYIAEISDHTFAEMMIAMMYYYGKGVQQDYDKAYKWANKVNLRERLLGLNKKDDTFNIMAHYIAKVEGNNFIEESFNATAGTDI